MATIIEDRPENEEVQPEAETPNLDDIAQPEEETVAEESIPDVPEKYQGKSVEELVAMHQQAEQKIGSQGNEVGELRKIVDDFITAQTVNSQEEQSSEDIDFFTDPDRAIEDKISKHPAIKKAEETANNFNAQTQANAITSKYPDSIKWLNDPQFKQWVQGSQTRQSLYARSQQLDFGAMDEMFALYGEHQNLVGNIVDDEKKARSNQVKAASTGSGRASRASTSKKTYRRADLIKLKLEDPDRYMSMQDEIMQAYADKRVK